MPENAVSDHIAWHVVYLVVLGSSSISITCFCFVDAVPMAWTMTLTSKYLLPTSRRLLVGSFVSVFCVENTHLFWTRLSQIGCEEVMLQTLQRSCDSFGHRGNVDITVENTVTICIYCLVNVRRVCQQLGWCCL